VLSDSVRSSDQESYSSCHSNLLEKRLSLGAESRIPKLEKRDQVRNFGVPALLVVNKFKDGCDHETQLRRKALFNNNLFSL
jgi:formyltetrahydrofolate synthetase